MRRFYEKFICALTSLPLCLYSGSFGGASPLAISTVLNEMEILEKFIDRH
jgi:hypothetical protein